MARIVVTDPLAIEGIELLRAAGHEVIDLSKGWSADDVASAEAWIVRSGTQIGAEQLAMAPNLRAIGRAGVGVDNIQLAAATEAGVAVFHAPTGNITSAAEQAWALMLAAARHVPAADAGMKNEQWLRKQLKGIELAGKKILIIGLGKIGRMMAERAQAFEMETLGHDPFVTPEAAATFGVRWVEVDAGFAEADIITLHTPLVPSTAEMVNAERLALCKDGVMLVNAARGGLVDMDALLAALESGKVGSAGLDVWPEEPPTDWSLAKHPRVVAAPHLGASTVEAQTKAATQACERVANFLASGDAGLAVNAQGSVPPKMRPWADLARNLASFASQTVVGSISTVTVAATPGIDVEAMKIAALSGALSGVVDDVNAINAPGLAEERGWTVATRKLPEDDTEYLRIQVRGSEEVTMEGICTPHYGARTTMFDGFEVDFRPLGRFLVTRHQDVPGVLAAITKLLAEAGVNVANLSLSRRDGKAVAVIRVDGSIPQSARDGLRELTAISQAHRIRVGQ